ncbi:ParA family protein [Sulfuriflexus mobilis]|uniref:ParA family protein n=1 Tax=Sulfuriflexus mobilis TaxID=1811807 RepID=UPI000F83D7A7|nr:ParA family protein [Sulfuriflexus mobilis]
MRTIMVINAKGGCGKTTLSTNIAGFYASKGHQVALADFDPQGSSLDWLKARPEDRAPIHGIAAYEGTLRPPRDTDYLILDVPAAVHGKILTQLVRRAESLIIPVLPSPIDMRACAHFIEELLLVGKVNRDEVKLAVVANRVRENTLIYHSLEKFLKRLKIPRIATLRETQNYIRAAERGLSIFEMAPSQVEQDVEQWKSLTRWLNSKRSVVE